MVDDARDKTMTWWETYLVAANITEDDDATNATTHIMYASPNYPMTLEFFGTKNNDVVLAVGNPEVTVSTGFNKKPVKYIEEVPITLYAVNKTGLTAIKVLNKAEKELRRIIELYNDAAGVLRVVHRTNPDETYLGGFFLYSWEFVISYRRSPAQAPTTAFVSYGNGYLEDFNTGIYAATVYTAEAGSDADTIICSTLTQGNDYWNGHLVKMLTGTYAGVEKRVTDFATATDELTTEAFAGAIDAGDTFILSTWMETEDGNTTTPTITSNDWLTLTVSATGGSAVSYYSYPSEATGHAAATHINLAGLLYTKVRWRYICTDNSQAKIVLVFSDGNTQTVLDATNSTSWTVGSATVTSTKTVDHIRLYANGGTGTVVYDFIQISKGNFVFPNIVSVDKNFLKRDAILPVFGAGGDSSQGGGSASKQFTLTCDLTVSNDTNDWKRPQGNATKTSGDSEYAQVFDEIVHESYDPDNEWQWISLEQFGAFKALISIESEPEGGDESTLVLSVREYPGENANSQTEAQRFNRS